MRCERCFEADPELTLFFADTEEEQENPLGVRERRGKRIYCRAMNLCRGCRKELREEMAAFCDRFVLQKDGSWRKPRANPLGGPSSKRMDGLAERKPEEREAEEKNGQQPKDYQPAVPAKPATFPTLG